jgi:hypothetical protein
MFGAVGNEICWWEALMNPTAINLYILGASVGYSINHTVSGAVLGLAIISVLGLAIISIVLGISNFRS